MKRQIKDPTIELEKLTKEFKEQAQTSLKNSRKIIKSYQSQMPNFHFDIDSKFGKFLTTVLYPLNNHPKQISGRIQASKKFYRLEDSWSYMSGKDKKIKKNFSEDALFHLYSKEFVNLIEDSKKKAIASEFLRFSNAVNNSFSQFALRQKYVITTPFQTVKLQHLQSDFASSTETEYLYKTADEQLYVDYVYIIVAKRFVKPISKVYFNGIPINNMPPQLIILPVKIIDGRPYVFDLLKMKLNDSRNSASQSSKAYCNLDFFINNHADLAFSAPHIRNENLLHCQLLRRDYKHIFTSEGVDLGTAFDENFRNMGNSAVMNWNEILQDPVIIKVINDYIANWRIISKTWDYLQSKFCYKLIEKGIF